MAIVVDNLPFASYGMAPVQATMHLHLFKQGRIAGWVRQSASCRQDSIHSQGPAQKLGTTQPALHHALAEGTLPMPMQCNAKLPPAYLTVSGVGSPWLYRQNTRTPGAAAGEMFCDIAQKSDAWYAPGRNESFGSRGAARHQNSFTIRE
jgi:hypothetical protein